MTFRGRQLAVIGSGYWGKNLIRNYHQLGVLKIICDKNESVLTDFARQYPDVETCMAFSDVLCRDDITAVVIATPAETHYDLGREALMAGKHVYVEKPLVLNEKHAEQLIGMAKADKRVLMVGHMLQYHPVFVRLKELAQTGELGRINYIYSNRLNLGKIRREENILWSFAPHDISMILAIAGELPESVSATGGCYLHKKIADVTTTHMEFPSGLQAHVFVSWLHPYKEQKLIVVGENKMAVFDDTQPWTDKLLIYKHEIKWKNNIPTPSKADPERIKIPEFEPLRMECEHFLECITNGSTPNTDGNEGLRVLTVLNASQRSLDDDGHKIKLVEPPPENVDRVVDPLPLNANRDAETCPYFVHDTAVIDPGCHIAGGSKIWHFSHILANSVLGENCNIGQNVTVGPDVTIGKNCKIQNNVSVYKGVTLEDGVFCGPAMVFTNIINPRAEIRKMDQLRHTRVKQGATLGANCTIVCGHTIGRYALVGAGAVVAGSVDDHALVVGNPARRVGWVCQCGERLSDDLQCLSCGKKYENAAQGTKGNRLKADVSTTLSPY